jgi:hypothetical protein
LLTQKKPDHLTLIVQRARKPILSKVTLDLKVSFCFCLSLSINKAQKSRKSGKGDNEEKFLNRIGSYNILLILIITVSGFLHIQEEQEEHLFPKLADGTIWALHWENIMPVWMPDFKEKFQYKSGPSVFSQLEGKYSYCYTLNQITVKHHTLEGMDPDFSLIEPIEISKIPFSLTDRVTIDIYIANSIQNWNELDTELPSWLSKPNSWVNIIGKVDHILRDCKKIPPWIIQETPLAYCKLLPAINSVDYIMKTIGAL